MLAAGHQDWIEHDGVSAAARDANETEQTLRSRGDIENNLIDVVRELIARTSVDVQGRDIKNRQRLDSNGVALAGDFPCLFACWPSTFNNGNSIAAVRGGQRYRRHLRQFQRSIANATRIVHIGEVNLRCSASGLNCHRAVAAVAGGHVTG